MHLALKLKKKKIRAYFLGTESHTCHHKDIAFKTLLSLLPQLKKEKKTPNPPTTLKVNF